MRREEWSQYSLCELSLPPPVFSVVARSSAVLLASKNTSQIFCSGGRAIAQFGVVEKILQSDFFINQFLSSPSVFGSFFTTVFIST